MRRFARVESTFWMGATGREIRRRLGPEGLLVALHAVTCPSSHYLGRYYLPVALVAAETKIAARRVLTILRTLAEIGFLRYDEATETVWVIEMARYQVEETLTRADKRHKHVVGQLAKLRDLPFHREHVEHYREAFDLSSSFETLCGSSVSPSEGASKGLRRGFEGASKGLRRGFEGASKGLAAEGASKGLRRGFEGALAREEHGAVPQEHGAGSSRELIPDSGGSGSDSPVPGSIRVPAREARTAPDGAAAADDLVSSLRAVIDRPGPLEATIGDHWPEARQLAAQLTPDEQAKVLARAEELGEHDLAEQLELCWRHWSKLDAKRPAKAKTADWYARALNWLRKARDFRERDAGGSAGATPRNGNGHHPTAGDDPVTWRGPTGHTLAETQLLGRLKQTESALLACCSFPPGHRQHEAHRPQLLELWRHWGKQWPPTNLDRDRLRAARLALQKHLPTPEIPAPLDGGPVRPLLTPLPGELEPGQTLDLLASATASPSPVAVAPTPTAPQVAPATPADA